jgi:hypothetical protein
MKKLAKKISESQKTDENYNYKQGEYSFIRGSICTNNINYNGVEFGQFECPIEGFDYSATSCCGPLYEQYCCTNLELEHDKIGFYNPYEFKNNEMTNNGILVKTSFYKLFIFTFLNTILIKNVFI